jgi:hypothetical protein
MTYGNRNANPEISGWVPYIINDTEWCSKGLFPKTARKYILKFPGEQILKRSAWLQLDVIHVTEYRYFRTDCISFFAPPPPSPNSSVDVGKVNLNMAATSFFSFFFFFFVDVIFLYLPSSQFPPAPPVRSSRPNDARKKSQGVQGGGGVWKWVGEQK